MSDLDDFKQPPPQPPKQTTVHGSVLFAALGIILLGMVTLADAPKLAIFGFGAVPLVLIVILGIAAEIYRAHDTAAAADGNIQSSGGYGMIVIYSGGGGGEGDSGGDGHHCGSDGGDGGGDGGGGDGGGGD